MFLAFLFSNAFFGFGQSRHSYRVSRKRRRLGTNFISRAMFAMFLSASLMFFGILFFPKYYELHVFDDLGLWRSILNLNRIPLIQKYYEVCTNNVIYLDAASLQTPILASTSKVSDRPFSISIIFVLLLTISVIFKL